MARTGERERLEDLYGRNIGLEELKLLLREEFSHVPSGEEAEQLAWFDCFQVSPGFVFGLKRTGNRKVWYYCAVYRIFHDGRRIGYILPDAREGKLESGQGLVKMAREYYEPALHSVHFALELEFFFREKYGWQG
ncbi:hypothetical protein [Ammonifex thiophilus]|uniref:Uncharacterized protein n=1 Tax=Ammonifex thiophilus TaxID=444093 RepID=A0A3D8P445_9THEO|nr:hypothetical protein [Ammonifex thiophilus]RDV83889.1 hypothetical protein DXX99_03380 [Ammonifex thiophilus]